MPFGKTSVLDKFNPSSFFSTPKVCHNKPVFDTSKDIMQGIEGLKLYRIIPGS